MYKLVIFDLDGTLVNSLADLGNACNEALAKFGFPTYDIENTAILWAMAFRCS